MRDVEDIALGTFAVFTSPYFAGKLISTSSKWRCSNKNNTDDLKELKLVAFFAFFLLSKHVYRENNHVKRTVFMEENVLFSLRFKLFKNWVFCPSSRHKKYLELSLNIISFTWCLIRFVSTAGYVSGLVKFV